MTDASRAVAVVPVRTAYLAKLESEHAAMLALLRRALPEFEASELGLAVSQDIENLLARIDGGGE